MWGSSGSLYLFGDTGRGRDIHMYSWRFDRQGFGDKYQVI